MAATVLERGFQRLKRVLEDTDTRAGRWFDAFILSLIVLSLFDTALETLPSLTPAQRAALSLSEQVIIVVFTAEYLARMAVADQKVRFLKSFQGIIDLLAILPFYLSTGLDLRAVRSLRLVRLARVLKLTRYTRALDRLARAFVVAREELILFVVASGLVIYLAAVGIYYFENPAQPDDFASVFHSMWWALATLTTVGYGDVVPITAGGRIFTAVVLAVGLGVVAVPSGIVASALTEARSTEGRDPTVGAQEEPDGCAPDQEG